MNRISQINGQATANAQRLLSNPTQKADDDVVIVAAYRTALTRARKGPLKDTPPEYMLGELIKETVKRSGVNPADCDDLVVGNVLMPGAGALIARAAQLMAGKSL
jgi:acetyl-CoA acyltransferase 1